MLLPPEFAAVTLMLQLPKPNVDVVFLTPVSNVNHELLPLQLLAPQFQLVGLFVDVSLNTIWNGASPAQPCAVLLVADVMFLEVNNATKGVTVI